MKKNKRHYFTCTGRDVRVSWRKLGTFISTRYQIFSQLSGLYSRSENPSIWDYLMQKLTQGFLWQKTSMQHSS